MVRAAPARSVPGAIVDTELRPILFGRHGGAVIEGMFRALCAYPYGLTNPQLRAAIYSPGCEPEWSQNCIQVGVCRFNRLAKRRGLGLRIRGSGGPGSKYRLYVVKHGRTGNDKR